MRTNLFSGKEYEALIPRFAGIFLVLCILFGTVSLAVAAPLIQIDGGGREIFQQKCSPCHTIGGGPGVGPDLEGVTERRELVWLEGFIAAPDEVIASGDPIATGLLAEYNNVTMPNLGLSEAEVAAIMEYLKDPGDLSNQSAITLPPGSADQGEKLFTGKEPLSNGGTSCFACHNVAGIDVLGGGNLGPDLTQVYSRYGASGLQAALVTLSFPTMQGVFADKPLTEREQADLYAFFESTDGRAVTGTAMAPLWFLVIGTLGAIVLFAAMYIHWPRQRQSLAESLRERA